MCGLVVGHREHPDGNASAIDGLTFARAWQISNLELLQRILVVMLEIGEQLREPDQRVACIDNQRIAH